MTTTEKPLAKFDVRSTAERVKQATDAAETSLAHMDTSLALAEAQLAVVRHHQARRLSHELAG